MAATLFTLGSRTFGWAAPRALPTRFFDATTNFIAENRHSVNVTSTLQLNVGFGYDVMADRDGLTAIYAGAPAASFVTYGQIRGWPAMAWLPISGYLPPGAQRAV